MKSRVCQTVRSGLLKRPFCTSNRFLQSSTGVPKAASKFPGFGIDEVQDTFLEDMTTLTLDELAEHQELRKYYRKIVYELPSLAEFTKKFEPPQSGKILRFRYTTYLGEDHPAESKVVLEVDVRKLDLTTAQSRKFIKLAGCRYDFNTKRLKMSCEQFQDVLQNKKYLSDLLDKLIAEAKNEADMFEDIPFDRRHMKDKSRPGFPKAWRKPSHALDAPAQDKILPPASPSL